MSERAKCNKSSLKPAQPQRPAIALPVAVRSGTRVEPIKCLPPSEAKVAREPPEVACYYYDLLYWLYMEDLPVHPSATCF